MRQIIDLLERSQTEVRWKLSRYQEYLIKEGSSAVVWVDVPSFDRAFARDTCYVGRGGEGGIRTRYPDFGQWLASNVDAVEMPDAGYGAHGTIMFGNGRHRYAWMRDHGARALPIVTHAEDVEQIEREFGTSLRRTILTLDAAAVG